ncbi:MAG: potassium transporter TrkG [Acidobacteriota bacterium]|jgi:trk system potassium uptake protein TrkH|nr:potassium transporter TrkG [Acidobacteriota bacterium]
MRRTFNISTVLHLLGYLVFVIGILHLFPLGISFLYAEHLTEGLLLSMLLSLVSGFLAMRIFANGRELSLRDGFLVVSLGWFLMACYGSLPYLFTGAIPSFVNAFFESMSGFTTTGASILADIEAMPKALLFWRALTHWIGGMGIIVLSLAILPLLGVGGMQLFKAEVPGPTADRLTPRIKDTARVLWLVYVGITLVEIVLLTVGGMNLFDAVSHAFATMATGGFSTRNASIQAFHSPYLDGVITLFMFLAGVNFALHYRFLLGRFNAYWRDFEFRVYLGIALGATFFLTFSNFLGGIFDSIWESLRYGVFQAVSIDTTTGFMSADYERWTPLAQVLIFLLMFVGGSAGSTGGGMKVMRLIVVAKQGLIELRRLLHPQAVIPLKLGKQVIPRQVVHAITGFFLLYVGLFVIVSIVMTTLGLDLLTAIGASASCIGNIGPGLGLVGPTDNYAFLPGIGKMILAFTMMVGRLEIFTVLVLFTRDFWSNR